MHFNSHAHVERDLRKLGTQYGLIRISTHTLTWSVTCNCICCYTRQSNFNSHAHVERDRAAQMSVSSQRHFNSHAHVERDQGSWTRFCSLGISTHTLTWSVTCLIPPHRHLYVHFNSHAHVERDSYLSLAYDNIDISTHTLTWSVTGAALCRTSLLLISTHTLTWSVTKYQGWRDNPYIISTHTLTWSVTA